MDDFLKNKLMLIEVSKIVKQSNSNFYQTRPKIIDAYSYFHGQKILDGEADCNFLKGIQLVNAAFIKSSQNMEKSGVGGEITPIMH